MTECLGMRRRGGSHLAAHKQRTWTGQALCGGASPCEVDTRSCPVLNLLSATVIEAMGCPAAWIASTTVSPCWAPALQTLCTSCHPLPFYPSSFEIPSASSNCCRGDGCMTGMACNRVVWLPLWLPPHAAAPCFACHPSTGWQHLGRRQPSGSVSCEPETLKHTLSVHCRS